MCVILACRDVRPTPEMVNKAWERNSYGGGVSWREKSSKGVVVKWLKGLDKEKMLKYCADLPLPFVAHFRIPSTGPGAEDPAFTHPFEISETAVPKLSGTTSRAVLFHNGTWNTWKFDIKEAVGKTGFKMPPGEWNDTRSLAHLAVCYGEGALSLVEEKILVFGPDRMNFYGKGWSKVDGIMVSNQLFLSTTSSNFQVTDHRRQHGGYTPPSSVQTNSYSSGNVVRSVAISKGERTGGSSSVLDIPFRGYLQDVSQWLTRAKRTADQQVSVQEGTEAVRTTTATEEGKEEKQETRAMTILAPTNIKKYRSSGKTGDPITTKPSAIRFLGYVEGV